jgi:hypothetical protein
MGLIGNYSSLGSFLVSLEKSDKIFEVTSISFGSNPQSESLSGLTQFQTQQTYTFNLQIKTHSY